MTKTAEPAPDDVDPVFEAMVESESAKLAADDPPAPEPEAEPFEITLWFRNGQQYTTLVTAFSPIAIPNAPLVGVDWKQDSAEPGDELMSWVLWSEVIMVTVRSLDGRPNRAARRANR